MSNFGKNKPQDHLLNLNRSKQSSRKTIHSKSQKSKYKFGENLDLNETIDIHNFPDLVQSNRSLNLTQSQIKMKVNEKPLNSDRKIKFENDNLKNLQLSLDQSLQELEKPEYKQYLRKQNKQKGEIPDFVTRKEHSKINKLDIYKFDNMIQKNDEEHNLKNNTLKYHGSTKELKNTLENKLDIFKTQFRKVNNILTNDLTDNQLKYHMAFTKYKPTNYAEGIDLEFDDMLLL